MVWTGIYCVGPLLHLRNHCITPIKCNGMEALLCISMMILELSQNGCNVLCKARSYITALLTKTMVVKASKPLSEYLPFQIWQLESSQKGWNVKSASFLPHDPFIGRSMGRKGAPPPPHFTGPSHSLISCNFQETFGKVVCCMLNYKRLNGKMFVMCTLWIWYFIRKKYVYSVYIRTLTKCVLIVSIFILQL